MNKKVSILIPCYNEEAGLSMLYDALCGNDGICERMNCYQWEIVFINDGSTDKTLDIIKKIANTDNRVKYVSLSRNFGKECAMLAGFDYVSGDCMVVMDADLQDPPELIEEMLEWWEKGYEDVYAKRISRGKESWLRKRLSLSFYALLQKSSRFDVLKNVGDFRLLDRKCIEVLKNLRENERYTKGMFAWIGFNKKEIVFKRHDRSTGSSNWNLYSLFNLGIEGITSFTTAPLRMAAIIGCVISIVAFGYLGWVLIKAWTWGDPVIGYPSMMAVILFLGGIQLLCLGIIGEYLGRVFNETKNRPVYIVSETNITK